MNGVKADLINRIKGELDRYAIVRDTVRYEKVKNALFLAHPRQVNSFKVLTDDH